jgi:hypothetical protein
MRGDHVAFLLAEFDRDLVRTPRQRRVQYLGRLRQLRGVDWKVAAAPPLAGHPHVPDHGRSFGTGNNQRGASEPAIREYSRKTSNIVNKYRPSPLLYFSI